MKAYKKLPESVRNWVELPIIITKAFKLRGMYKRNGWKIIYPKINERKEIPYRIVHFILTF